MKTTGLFLSAALLFAACSNDKTANTEETPAMRSGEVTNAVQADTANAAQMTFATEVYDFGKISDGEKVTHDFTFKNTGSTPLIITSAVATCGCTVPDYPREPIAPGAEGKIQAIYDSKGQVGMQNKVITLTANTVPSTIELRMMGEVTAKQ